MKIILLSTTYLVECNKYNGYFIGRLVIGFIYNMTFNNNKKISIFIIYYIYYKKGAVTLVWF